MEQDVFGFPFTAFGLLCHPLAPWLPWLPTLAAPLVRLGPLGCPRGSHRARLVSSALYFAVTVVPELDLGILLWSSPVGVELSATPLELPA